MISMETHLHGPFNKHKYSRTQNTICSEKAGHDSHVYNQIITEQETRGFIEQVDISKDHSGSHYILHHPVEKVSFTTPTRIVFDYSC